MSTVSDVSYSMETTTSAALSANSSSLHTENPRLANGIIVLVLFIMNLVGNSLVFYIYNCYIKHNVFSLFVRVLAILDLTEAIAMVLDAMMKTRPLDESVLNLTVICKITHYLVYTLALTNSCVLTIIAYQRYRKICHSLKPEMSLYQAKLFLLIATVACAVICLPFLVVHGPEDVNLATPGGDIVQVAICRYDVNYANSTLQKVMSTLLMVVFVIVLILTISFYVRVYVGLRKFENRASVRNGARPESSLSAVKEDKNSPSQAVMGSPGFPLDAHRAYLEDGETPPQDVNNAAPVKAEDRNLRHIIQTRMSRAASVFSTNGQDNTVSAQMYKTFIIITVVFVISYLPHLIVNKVLAPSLNDHVLTYVQRFFYELAYNCPYISTVANAFIYGFRNADFRQHCLIVIRCKCRKRHHRRRR